MAFPRFAVIAFAFLLARSASGAPYADLLAAGDTLATEQSWEQAKVRYTEALAAAPNTDARAHCELLIEDATWHSEFSPSARWREGDKWQERHLAAFDRLELPYHEGDAPRARDEFWQDVVTHRAKFEQFVNLPIAWKHYAAVAQQLGSQPSSPEAAHHYIAFLQGILSSLPSDLPREFFSLRPYLVRGAQFGATPDDRAWCAWQLARIGDFRADRYENTLPHAPDYNARWSAAVVAAAGTRWAPLIHVEEFLWRVSSRWSPTLPADTPADVPAILTELREARQRLGNEPNTEAQSARTRLDLLERSLVEPRLYIQIGDTFIREAPLRFNYGTSGLARLSIALDRVDGSEWLALPNFEPQAHSSVVRPATRKNVREWEIPLPDPARLSWSTQTVEIAPQLPSGLYILTVSGLNANGSLATASQHKFLVSSVNGLGVFASAAPGKFFAYHAADGRPVVGAVVSGVPGAGSVSPPWHDTTDALGAVALPPWVAQARSALLFVDNEPVWFIATNVWSGEQRPLFVDAYTDQPLFRPGETAHWKLIVREHHEGHFSIPTDLTGLNLRVMLGDVSLIAPTPLQLSASGTAHGEIMIPADAHSGQAMLQIFHGNTPDRAVDSNTLLFHVDRFVAPAALAKLEFIGDPRSFRPGHDIMARVTASYFSGGPLAHTPVRFTFSADDRFAQKTDELSNWLSTLTREPQSAVTDARGEAEVTLSLPAFLPENFQLHLTTALTPEGGPPLAAHSSLTLSATGLTLDPLGWVTPRLASPNDVISFAGIIRDGRGSPVALDVRAQLVEVRWSEVWLDAEGQVVPPAKIAALWGQKLSHQERPADWKLIHAAYTESLVEETIVRTSAEGRLSAKFKLPHAGVFRLRAIADSEIALATSRDFRRSPLFNSWREGRRPDRPDDSRLEPLSLVAVDDHTDSLALNPETAALIAPAELSPASPLRVLAITPVGATQAWISLAGESAVIAESVPFRSRLALHTFDRLPSLFGEAKLEFVHRFADVALDNRIQTTITVSSAPHELHVTVAPNASESRPGQPAAIVLTAHDATGRPAAAAELAVRVADEAVISLLSDDSSEPAPRFPALRSTLHSRLSVSRDIPPGLPREIRPIVDPRNGAIRNPTSPFFEENELIQLSTFSSVAQESRGYTAMSTLAGTRLRSDLKTVAAALPVVGEQPDSPAIQVRRHFSSTAFWSPDVITDSRGEARVTFTYPDNLTRWRIGAYALGADGDTFGTANAFTRTSLPFQARLQLPRFLIVGDTSDLSATLVNRSNGDLSATASLELSGVTPRDPATLTHANLLVSKQSEAHTAWSIHATAAGEAQVTLTSRAGPESDAMSLPLPIFEDGLQQHTAAFARLAPDAARTDFTIELPAPLDPTRTRVSVQLSPNYATTLLDALPYLVNYPYGCVEQTMSRFLPAVVVRKTLIGLGLNADAVDHRILTRESPADQTRRQQTAGLAHLDDVVRQSLARLEEAQTYQGFGWWPGARAADLWMTAYVAWGLSLASDAGIKVPADLDSRTTQALFQLVTETTVYDDRLAFAWAALAAAREEKFRWKPGVPTTLFTKAFEAREHLSATGRACLALAAKKFGTLSELQILVRNLDNGVERASAAGLGDTAHWGVVRDYWRASDGAREATALTLLALVQLDPKSPLIEPAANWLVLNRRSAHWSNTRDTTFAVLALNAYLQARGHLDSPGEIELLADDTLVQRIKFSQDTLLTNPSTIAIPLTSLHSGSNTFTLRRIDGSSPVHAVALASSWARGNDVKSADHLVKVERRFERQKAEPTLIGALRLTPELLGSSGSASMGEEVTARITLTVPNELEYVKIEVPKPAGCEPLNPLSGWDARLVRVDVSTSGHATKKAQSDEGGRALYREEYDDHSAFFLDHIEAGTWELRFGLRAVTPGDFRALPVVAEAMYAPEITANSDARRVSIKPTSP